jgi:DNA primase
MSLDQIVNACKYLLHHCPDAEKVLEYTKERISQESQEKFLFGYFPPNSKISLLTGLIGEELLKEQKLLFSKHTSETNKFLNYFEDHPMVLPYRDVYGNIIALIGRNILSEAERKERKISKYKNTVFNKGNHLFGLYEAKEEIISCGFAYVVEGQFDTIKANENGIKNIVGLGNSNMTPYQASLLARYTDTLFLVLDNDEAGEKGRKRIVDKFGNYLHINNLYLPEGYKDIDEYLSQNNAESLTFLC